MKPTEFRLIKLSVPMKEFLNANRNITILFLRFFLGSVFIFSAYSKLFSPGIVEIILIDNGIIPTRDIAALLVRILIGFELSIGLLFFQPFFLKKLVLPVSFLFLGALTLYLGYAGFILKDTQNCGCFGEIIKMPPLESIIKNIVLMVFIIFLYRTPSVQKRNYFILPVIAVISALIVFVAAPIKFQKDFKFSLYTNFEGKGRVDLSSGENMIVVLNLECDHCQQLAKDLSQLKRKMKWFPHLYALLFIEGRISVDSFKTITDFYFPYYIIGAQEFFDLIGQAPPRIYYLKDGAVKEVWDNNFTTNILPHFFRSRLPKESL